jgi:hypothetical protein
LVKKLVNAVLFKPLSEGILRLFLFELFKMYL